LHQAPLDKYVCEYPLHKFSKWFIDWAQGVMAEKEDIAVNLQNKGYKFNYHSILPVSAEVAKEATADLKSAVSASPSKGNGKKLDDIKKSSTKVAEIASKQSLSIVSFILISASKFYAKFHNDLTYFRSILKRMCYHFANTMKYYVVLYLHPTKEDRKVSLTIPPSRK
jgi:hypothetical protein